MEVGWLLLGWGCLGIITLIVLTGVAMILKAAFKDDDPNAQATVLIVFPILLIIGAVVGLVNAYDGK